MKNSILLLLACLLVSSCTYRQAFVPDERQMASKPAVSKKTKRIGLVAHDACKPRLLAWVKEHAPVLVKQEIFCTGTTGRLVAETLEKSLPGTPVALTRFNSGPLGGDQQMGALIAQGGLDILIFFIDPMSSHPHDADIKALMRLSAVHNIVVAFTPATAEYIVSSPLFEQQYTPEKPAYGAYVNRNALGAK